jgi:hypothetical protein
MKVSRKVARRSHRSRYSSVSRRRLRNKKSRSGYRKKNAKTQQGGARSRKYSHKRGKRFHRGGVIINEYKLNGVLLEYKKKNDNIFTTSDTKMFKPVFYENSEEDHHQLKLTRCSGKDEQSCKVKNEHYMSFRLGTNPNNPLKKTLKEFGTNSNPLIVEGYDKSGISLGVTYTLPASTLNKQSFGLLLKQVMDPPHTETPSSSIVNHQEKHYLNEQDEATKFANKNPESELAKAKLELANANLKYHYAVVASSSNVKHAGLIGDVEQAKQAVDEAKEKVIKLEPPLTIIAPKYISDDPDDEDPQMASRIPQQAQ